MLWRMRLPGLLSVVLAAAHAGRVDAQAAQLKLVRDLVIETPSPNFPPRRVVVAPNGDLVVSNQAATHALLIFGHDGQLKRSIGTGTDSAGWFGLVGVLGRVGDTIWVHDAVNARTTFLAPGSYQFARVLTAFPSVRLSSAEPVKTPAPDKLYSSFKGGPMQVTNYPLGMRDNPAGFLADGTLLTEWIMARARPLPDWMVPGTEENTHLLRVDTSGVFLRHVETYPRDLPPSCLASYTADRRGGEVAGVNCPPQFSVLSADGRIVVVVQQDNHLAPGDSSSFAIRAVTTTGRTLYVQEVRYRAQAYPDSELTPMVASRQKAYAGDSLQLAAFNSIDVPRTFYPVGQLRAGEDGTVWYVHRSRWVGLDENGNQIGSFPILRGTSMLAISREYAWVGESDGKGGSHIVRYRIEH